VYIYGDYSVSKVVMGDKGSAIKITHDEHFYVLISIALKATSTGKVALIKL